MGLRLEVIYMTITCELAEILGLLCVEGSHILSYSNYTEKYKGKTRFRRNKKSERIEFYNKDKNLLLHYQKLLLKEFNYSSNITKHDKINIGKQEIISLITSHTQLGHLSWNVPEGISESENEVKISFLRGYFDGDGTSSGNVRFFSTNKQGMVQISSLLSNLGFKHMLQGPIIKIKRKPSYIIQISRKDENSFLKAINPVSKKKTL